MTAPTCPRCTRPVGDAYVCSTCGADVERALRLVAFLEPELDIAISRQVNFTADSDGSPSSTRSLPLNMQASNAAGKLRVALVGWTRGYVADTDADTPANTLTAMAAFLLHKVEWLRHHAAAPDAVDEVVTAVARCRKVIDAPENRTTFTVGPCPEVDNAGCPCVGEVRAYIPTSTGEPARMACPVCGSTYQTWQWMRAGRRILDRRAEIVSRGA